MSVSLSTGVLGCSFCDLSPPGATWGRLLPSTRLLEQQQGGSKEGRPGAPGECHLATDGKPTTPELLDRSTPTPGRASSHPDRDHASESLRGVEASPSGISMSSESDKLLAAVADLHALTAGVRERLTPSLLTPQGETGDVECARCCSSKATGDTSPARPGGAETSHERCSADKAVVYCDAGRSPPALKPTLEPTSGETGPEVSETLPPSKSSVNREEKGQALCLTVDSSNGAHCKVPHRAAARLPPRTPVRLEKDAAAPQLTAGGPVSKLGDRPAIEVREEAQVAGRAGAGPGSNPRDADVSSGPVADVTGGSASGGPAAQEDDFDDMVQFLESGRLYDEDEDNDNGDRLKEESVKELLDVAAAAKDASPGGSLAEDGSGQPDCAAGLGCPAGVASKAMKINKKEVKGKPEARSALSCRGSDKGELAAAGSKRAREMVSVSSGVTGVMAAEEETAILKKAKVVVPGDCLVSAPERRASDAELMDRPASNGPAKVKGETCERREEGEGGAGLKAGISSNVGVEVEGQGRDREVDVRGACRRQVSARGRAKSAGEEGNPRGGGASLQGARGRGRGRGS
eukprot:jgi/Mesen1/9697/ME000069S09108